MRVFLRKVFRVVYFYLMTAGLPVLLMHLALENERLSAALYAGALLLALPLSLLPGKVLRGKLPLRFPLAALLGVLIIAGTTAFAVQNGFFFLRGTLAGAIMALMMLFSMREATLEFPLWTGQHGASIGLVLYLFGAGVTGSLVPAPFLNGLFWGESLLFLLCTAFYLNADNMLTGLATRKNANPPKSLVTGNRIMTVVFACIAALVIFWSQLQDAAGRFGKWVLLMILRFLYFIGQLLSGEESQGGQQQQMDPTAMFAEFGETETSSFWAFLEKVAVVLAIVIGVVLVALALRVVFRLILRGLRHLREYMARFAQVTGEDYEDEQIDLFDLDDLREQTKERLQKAMRRLTRRTKKWDDMDAREKVRFSVRQLYAKAGYTNGELNPLTIREAAPKLPSTPFGEERLADLYEKARYSQTEPTAQEAEELRKAVKH